MAVESVTYVTDLNTALPATTDPKSEGDDHIRNLKTALKNTFPNLNAPVTATPALLNSISSKADLASPAFTGTPTAPTAAATTNSTQLATTAMVQAAILNSSGITAQLPAQGGNSGKFLTTNGTSASWAVSGIGQVSSTVTANTTLTASSAGYQFVQMASLGQSVTLPDATTLTVGGPRYIIDNTKGGYPCGIRDNTGTLVMAVAAGGEAFVSLKDNSTAAGSWSVTGSNLEPGLITIDSTFSSTYTSTVLAPFVALDNNTSIHFAALASGFAAFVVDNTGKVVSTPVTVTSTASSVPVQVFKVSSTSAIVFYSSSAAANSAVVLTLTGASPTYSISVGTPAASVFTTGASGWDGENFSGTPKIAQLSSTSYIASANNSVNAVVIALTVSGTTVTAGSSTTVAASTLNSSTTTYPLTATTALVLYKTGAAAPYANNAVVISVSGTTCTVNTPVALTGCQSSLTAAPASTLVSATKCIITDDNNTAGSVIANAITISGTTVTAGTALSVETGITTSFSYTTNSATRYNPHLWTLTTGATNTVGLWYFDGSSISRVVVLSETSGTITAGTILYRSISRSNNTDGLGGILAQGTQEFISLTLDGASGSNHPQKRFVPHKITGTSITVGASQGAFASDLSVSTTAITGSFSSARLASGDYVTGLLANAGSANSAIPVLRTNGDCINYRGSIRLPPLSGPFYPVPNNGSNRLMLLGNTQAGGNTVNATTYQLRLLNVEIAA